MSSSDEEVVAKVIGVLAVKVDAIPLERLVVVPTVAVQVLTLGSMVSCPLAAVAAL